MAEAEVGRTQAGAHRGARRGAVSAAQAWSTDWDPPAQPLGRGLLFSGLLHVLALAFLLWGVVETPSDAPAAPTLGTVTLISAADFQGAVAAAPRRSDDVVRGVEGAGAPDGSDDPGAAGNAAAPSDATDAAQPAALPDAPAVAGDSAPPPSDIAPAQSPVPSELRRPTIAETPSPDTLPREAAVPESPASTEPVQPLASRSADLPDGPPTAPPQPEEQPDAAAEAPAAADEAASETAEAATNPDAPSDVAPRRAALPVARPADLAAAAPASSADTPVTQPADEPAETDTDTADTAPAAEDQAVADAIAAALAEVGQTAPADSADSADQARGDTLGPTAAAPTFAARMTGREKEALSLGIRDYFSYSGREERGLRVTMEILLSEDGRIVDGPRQVDGRGDRAVQDALSRAARRALIQAQNAGVFADLPRAKYDAWRWIHVTFSPEEGVGFPS
ncbi:MAG: hypothetical protein AAF677_07475 [Pseudomonadota bacterium]